MPFFWFRGILTICQKESIYSYGENASVGLFSPLIKKHEIGSYAYFLTSPIKDTPLLKIPSCAYKCHYNV